MKRLLTAPLCALLVAAFVLAGAPGQAHAQDKVGTTAAPFLTIGVGARALAMGGAQAALASGPTALYWNPSAITTMRTSGFEFSHTEWFVGSTYQHAALVLNLGGAGHVGLSLLALDYGQMEVTTVANPDGTGELYTPRDLAVGLTYSRALTDRFALGGTVKLVSQRIRNVSDSGLAVDLGVNYVTDFRGLRIGMTMTNFGTGMQLGGRDLRQAIDIDPQIAGNNDRLGALLETDEWSLPLTFTVGLAVDAVQMGNSRVTLSVDATAPADNAQMANVGLEYSFNDLFYLRGGVNRAFATQSEDTGLTGGVGVRYSINNTLAGYFDYAYLTHDVFDAPQVFSLGVTF
jgi:hypothetical protein